MWLNHLQNYVYGVVVDGWEMDLAEELANRTFDPRILFTSVLSNYMPNNHLFSPCVDAESTLVDLGVETIINHRT